LREWFRAQLIEVLGENPDNIHYVVLNIHEAKDDIFRLVYDYQVQRQWPSVAANTADVLQISLSNVYNLKGKK